MPPRRMALTPDHVARVHRDIEYKGLDPAYTYRTDEEYQAIIDDLLAQRPETDEFWLFASGSLIWKPEVEHLERRIATIRGYHRSFCLHMRQWRATPEQPGLMMALDRGGQCKGVIFRLDHDAMEEQLRKLLEREMRMRPSNNLARWVAAQTDKGPVPALAFVMNREGPGYVGRLPIEETVTMLARACGHIGSCAEYLYNTVAHLEELGIHDRHLWHLQQLVARRIAEDHGLDAPAE
ncbi:gamma-glutamylcyclotransferase [Microbaculum marinisediminis]|uniref:glutathione-specific gamma-glutamylcyclotransferase n=1 Tax=Microbaculum marinisediminis TaxID=2931392 RepID=A0AAW5QX86_9HYPH|nr:gamma-glutamylcyclotransferase [Microbaculum sp. A6E488]MCT8971592.1 gamma-glutamylcyclotransferase [Microbaculum sp. A6E488]